uniref:Uncharacterized protein n=1 Tax=Solanum lycopersicum TaxID=4081 RepID=A0A3Q7FWW4_SOLLC
MTCFAQVLRASLLPLLSCGFRIHLISLNKLSAINCSFKLSGYFSAVIFIDNTVIVMFYSTRQMSDFIWKNCEKAAAMTGGFVMYFTSTISKEANALQVLSSFPQTQTSKKFDLHTSLLKLYSDLIDLLVCIYNPEAQTSEDDLLCPGASPSPLHYCPAKYEMKLVNIWNSKLQAQGECTSTRDGKSKEDEPFLSFVHDLNKN